MTPDEWWALLTPTRREQVMRWVDPKAAAAADAPPQIEGQTVLLDAPP